MTDEGSGTGSRTPLTPDEEALVTERLAEAAGPLTVPEDVAARLQDVLDGLVGERAGERAGGEPSGPVGTEEPDGSGLAADVVELPSRRRWPKLMLAAAAVLVVGYGVASVTGQGSLSGSEDTAQVDSASAGSADSTAPREGDIQAEDGESNSGRSQTEASSPSADAQALAEAGRFPPRLRSERLDPGVRRALKLLDADATDGLLLDDAAPTCREPELGPDERFVPVLYDGRAAVMVTRPADDGLVDVTVYSCGGSELDSTILEP